MKFDDVKADFPGAEKVRVTGASPCDSFALVDDDDEVIAVLNVFVFDEGKGFAGRETCIDVFHPNAKEVEAIHFTAGERTFTKFPNVPNPRGGDPKGKYHMIGLIRRPDPAGKK
jgi:hypothetical protein